MTSQESARVWATELVNGRPCDQTVAEISALKLGRASSPALPVTIGASDGDPGGRTGKDFFTGKIEQPRIYCAWLDPVTLESIAVQGQSDDSLASLVAAWDFARDPHTTEVIDTSEPAHNGRTINLPTRSVTSHAWDGSYLSHKEQPDHYAAIHFHEDDLGDVGWEPSLWIQLPSDAPSGAYAVHLKTSTSEDRIPFWVRPRVGKSPKAQVVFLAPTLTDLAYANDRFYGEDAKGAKNLPGSLRITEAASDERDRCMAHFGLKSLYDRHLDGSGVCYASRLRPLLSMRPDYVYPPTGTAVHFSADLELVNWLNGQEICFDCVTDEDLHNEGSALVSPYSVLLTGHHPEYWTLAMLEALEAYLDGGGNVMYLGGNGLYWVTSVAPGDPQVIEVRRGLAGSRPWESAPGEAYHSTTGEPGGQWRLRGTRYKEAPGSRVRSPGLWSCSSVSATARQL